MPTPLTRSRWTPPFLGLGPADFWEAGGAADPLGWGQEEGRGHPTTRRILCRGAPVPGDGELARALGGGTGDSDRRRWKHRSTQGLARGKWDRERRQEEGRDGAGPRAPALPTATLPHFSENPNVSWRAMALVLPWQRLGSDPLLLTSPSPHKQSGRTHRPSRSCLFGSQSCEMQQ